MASQIDLAEKPEIQDEPELGTSTVAANVTVDKEDEARPASSAGSNAEESGAVNSVDGSSRSSKASHGQNDIVDQIFDRLEVIFGLKDSADNDQDIDGADPFYWQKQDTQRDYVKNSVYWMGQARREYARQAKLSAANRKRREEAEKSMLSEDVKIESMEEKSSAAYSAGERATFLSVHWTEFLAPKRSQEECILRPIELVIGEPEPQHILQLNKRLGLGRRNEDGTLSGNGVVSRPDELEHRGQVLLPERIKIHSGPLFRVLRSILGLSPYFSASADGSVVFRRPYRQFIHFEEQLKESLLHLEKLCQKAIRNKAQIDSVSDAGSSASSIADMDNPSVPKMNVEAEVEMGNIKITKVVAQEENANKNTSNPVTAFIHLRCLMDFINEKIKPKLDYIEGDSCGRVYFHDLCYLMKPGTEVVDQNEKQAYRVVRIEMPRHKVEEPWLRWYVPPTPEGAQKPEEDTPIRIHCSYVDFDGKQFGPVLIKFTIPPFGGLKDAKSLPIYPLRFAKDNKLRENLIERGKMLLDVSKYKSMYYSGYTFDGRDEIDSQVVIDFSEALADAERQEWMPKIDNLRTMTIPRPPPEICTAACCHGQSIINDEYIETKLTEDFIKSLVPDQSLKAPSLLLASRPLEEAQPGTENEPTDEELVVMTYRVFGFVLRSRKWAQLDMTCLSYENTSARTFTLSAFDQLELPTGHREMVKSLVTQHFRDRQATVARDEQTDLIKGKGKGLILLLHGAPGVGKTTTAEGVAELFQKPLFQITCGDLGNTARDVERELEKNFALASRWGCILLLDEADVFLAQRERKDFERNGLVAVFLRILEYYAGILFLTTNRVGDFDEAFASRIHMSLYYPALDEEKTKKVFTLNLDLIQQRFKRQNRKITFDASSVERFAGQHFQMFRYNRWNGRQIRNLCQTALALAEFDAQGGGIEGRLNADATVQLQLKYFELVQKAYLEFDEYLGDVRGTQTDQRAYDHSLRAKKDTPFQTTPSRFSRSVDEPQRGATFASSESRVPVQSASFQPLGTQGFAGGNNGAAYGQYYHAGHGAGGFSTQQVFPQQGVPQMDPRFYTSQQGQQGQQGQQPSQMVYPQQMQQNWAAPSVPMAYNSASQPSPMQQPQMQGFQGQGLQPQVPHGYPMASGLQSDTAGGAHSPGQPGPGAGSAAGGGSGGGS